jgi:hypothetical protein
MSLRTFTDSQGLEWQAFDVIPREVERRHYDRRSSGEVALDDPERREEDRRLTVGRGSLLQRQDGWLCFEHGHERRRLFPIPQDWFQASDATLEEYCRSAKAVKPVSFAKG